jgi:hypothetical protein
VDGHETDCSICVERDDRIEWTQQAVATIKINGNTIYLIWQ